MEQPTFVFAHFLTPHPDHVFKGDGSFLGAAQASGIPVKTRCIDQLIATNDMVKSLVDSLLAESRTPPIVILQADEGPYAGGGETWAWQEANDSELREKRGILNARYLPGADQNSFRESITPANSFRLLLNEYFDAGLDLLPDRSFVYRRGQPYSYYDVTQQLT